MSLIVKVILCAVTLAALSSAVPAKLKSAVQSRGEGCAIGTLDSQCADIAGCFNYDPCVDPSQPSTTQQRPKTQPECSIDIENPTRILPTTYWPISPNSKDQSYEAESAVYVKNDTTVAEDVIQQVIFFEGVPASAKKCSVGCFLTMQEDTVFEVEGDGYLRITQLDGLYKQQAPNLSSAMATEKTDVATTMPAMGGWDDKSVYMRKSSGMMHEVRCSEVLAFQAYLDPINDGEVFMEPSDSVGIAVPTVARRGTWKEILVNFYYCYQLLKNLHSIHAYNKYRARDVTVRLPRVLSDTLQSNCQTNPTRLDLTQLEAHVKGETWS